MDRGRYKLPIQVCYYAEVENESGPLRHWPDLHYLVQPAPTYLEMSSTCPTLNIVDKPPCQRLVRLIFHVFTIFLQEETLRLKRIAAASEKPQDSPSYSSTTVTAVS